MASWVFWLLIFIIVFLVAVILIRDKGIREAVKNLFLRLKKKIRMARIKSKINKENEKKVEILRNLGEEAWKKGIVADLAFEEKGKVDELTAEKKRTETEIEKRNAEIDTQKKALDAFTKKQETLIKEQEEKLEPLEKEFSRVKKELHDWEKDANEKERQIAKLEKKIAAYRQKIEENENDADLSKIEKQQNREEIEKTIGELENNRSQVQQEAESLRSAQPEKAKKTADLEPRIKEFEERIKTLKEKKKTEEKRLEETIDASRSNRNRQVGQQSELQKKLDSLFEKIGERINKKRVESHDLAALYTQIDNQNKIIKDLEKQIKTDHPMDKADG